MWKRIVLVGGLAGTAAATTPVATAAPAAAAPAAAAPTAAAPAAAAPTAVGGKDPAAQALERLALSIQRKTLENGLRVVLNPDRSSPTIAVSVTYDVGSRNEGPGQSGFAHLFEHMMFQGSQHVKKGEHFGLISERGGSLNGTTSADRTNYYEFLPASELELALFLEADRMRWLTVNTDNFENQRAVVKEEYRMRVDNAPYAKAHMRLGELTFADYFPYSRSTIGSMQDLDAAKLEWVAKFHSDHYAPNNAVVTVAGDFETDRALELIQKYFGAAARQTVPPFDNKIPDPPKKFSREVVEDKNAATPGILWGYRIPPARSKDHYAIELVAQILSDGESSRLHQKLVRDRASLQNVSAWTDDRRGPDMFGLMGILTEKGKLAEVEKAFDAELASLAKTPPTEEELTRAKSRLKHSFVFGLQSNAKRAIRLGEYEVYFGDARLLTRELSAYLAVTAADVQRVTQEYLKPGQRFEVEVQPIKKAATAPSKGAK